MRVVKNPFELEKIWKRYIKQMDRRGLKGLVKFNFVRHFYTYSNLYEFEWGYLGGDMIDRFIIPSHIIIYDNKKFYNWLKKTKDIAFLVPEDLGGMLKKFGFIEFPFNINIEWNGNLITKHFYIKPSIKSFWGLTKFLLKRKKFNPNVKVDWDEFNEWVDYFYYEDVYEE